MLWQAYQSGSSPSKAVWYQSTRRRSSGRSGKSKVVLQLLQVKPSQNEKQVKNHCTTRDLVAIETAPVSIALRVLHSSSLASVAEINTLSFVSSRTFLLFKTMNLFLLGSC